MSEFKLPKAWCCLAKSLEEDKLLTDYINSFHDNWEVTYDVSCESNCWFTNVKIIEDNSYYEFRSKNDPIPEREVITFEQFKEYVLGVKSTVSENIEEYNNILIKLLTE